MELDDVARCLGSPLRLAEPVGWGDSRATHRLSLTDGRTYAARRFAGPGSAAHVDRIGLIMARLAEAGLPVASATICHAPAVAWLLTPWIEGETGASWLGDPDRARHLADRMGRLANRLQALEFDADPPDGHRLAGPPAPDAAEEQVFVHGDFAPINVVMGADGEIAALLDFEHAGRGPVHLDVAWWGWVVRHHHHEAWTAAWPTLLAAAGLEPGHPEERLHALVLQALAARAAGSDDPDERSRWQQRLTIARAWTVPGDQAT
jgi:aminoglycoside phosphotransferase (APT) family kinase protein